MDVRVGLWRKLSAKELILLNCSVGEDSWGSHGLQFARRSKQSILKINPWCLFYINGNPLQYSCLENTHGQRSLVGYRPLSPVRLSATPWIVAHQASLSITNSQSSLRLKSIESVRPSSHLILCCPLFLLPPIPPSIRVFSNESTLRMRQFTYH